MREIRVSPDGESVAIKTDNDPEGRRAYGVINATHGGSWTSESTVADWAVISS